jgi:CRP-like cAMP-binding protein
MEIDKYIYYRIPKPLFTNDRYKKMLPLAKVLYGIFLDRTTLSRANGWVDEQGRVFFYFKRTEVAEMMGITEKTASILYKELEKYDLLEAIPQGKNLPKILYLGQYELST